MSGIGLANVYEFLSTEFPERVDPKIQKEFEEAGDDKGRVVAVNAIPGSLCLDAIQTMMRYVRTLSLFFRGIKSRQIVGNCRIVWYNKMKILLTGFGSISLLCCCLFS